MPYKINPAFDRFPKEAQIVGRILSSFGELELTVCHSAHSAMQLGDMRIFKALYKLRATSSRIDIADALMAPVYDLHGLQAPYDIALKMVRECLRLRNQYAHCNWADGQDGSGLFFADAQTSAENENFDHFYKHVDLPLLQFQFLYFSASLEWLRYVDSQLAIKQGKKGVPDWPAPLMLDPPPPHNPPSQHVPPWISADAQAAHLRRAAALEGTGQKQERPPSVLKLTLEDWDAKAKKGRLDAIAWIAFVPRLSSIALPVQLLVNLVSLLCQGCI